jgi:hypothetical protein
VAAGLSALVLTSVLISGCTSGPSTKEQVCTSFDALGTQLLQGNGIIGNPLFHKAAALADMAGRYPGSPNLADDAKALHRIAGGDSTSGMELTRATTHIAQLCGHPLASNALFGNTSP